MTHIPFVRRWLSVSTLFFGVAVCLAGVLAAPASAQLIPLGVEFQANTSAICAINARVVARPDGGFAVLWGDQMVQSFRGRFYDVDGIPETGELAIETGTSVIFEEAVQMPDGGFLGLWTSFPGSESTEGGGSEEVLGRRFAADGTPLGAQFAVSGPSTDVNHPRAAVDESGEFVVVWEDGAPGSGSIEGRRFASDGTPVGGQFTVTSSTSARAPEVAKQADSGEFTVVWYIAGIDADVAARIYDSSGVPTGGEFVVNSFGSGFHSAPDIALSTAGEMLVTWSGPTATSGGDTHTMLAFLDNSGVTEEEVVISNTNLFQWNPALAASPDLGSFVVGWEDMEEVVGGGGLLTADPRGAFNLVFDQQLTSTETAEQTGLAVAIDPAERATVVWLTDPDDNGCAEVVGIRVQLYKNLVEDETAVRVHSATQQLAWKYFQYIPGSPGNYEIGISQLTGDADLYVRTGALPDESSYDCRPFVGGLQEESCVVSFTGTPIWIAINGFDVGTTSLMLTTGPETPLFADGFESGSTSAWSLTVN